MTTRPLAVMCTRDFEFLRLDGSSHGENSRFHIFSAALVSGDQFQDALHVLQNRVEQASNQHPTVPEHSQVDATRIKV